MGDLQAWLDQPDGEAGDYTPPPSPPPPPQAANPHPSTIEAENWRRAEQTTQEIIQRIQPTTVSEKRRRAVVEYVQRLIRGLLGTEVLPFGSVPLKTYLPDGDIDLTALAVPTSEDSLAGDVCLALENEEQNDDAEFEVKDVQYIHAEVLYRFLDYYSKFDWDNYCISLYGPISVSFLPELVAEAPENDGGDLLLTEHFLRNCADLFSDSPRGLEGNTRSFPQKHLNIVDLLKENNNLGRSVSKGNLYRIRSAFTYGARKLGRILLLPAESIADEVNMFFMNTLNRHGSGERQDVQVSPSSCPESTVINHNENGTVSSEVEIDKSREDILVLGEPVTDSHGALCEEINDTNREDILVLGEPVTDSHGALCEEINDTNISGLHKEHATRMQLHKDPSNKQLDATWLNKCSGLESNGLVEGTVVSDRRLAGDAGDLARGGASGSGTTSETCETSPSNSDTSALPSGKSCQSPHLFHPKNGIENGISARDSVPNEEIGMLIRPDSYETESSTSSTPWYSNHGISAPADSMDGSLTSSGGTHWTAYPQLADCSVARNEGVSGNGSPIPNHVADLSGDYAMHFRSLLYAQGYREHFLGIHRPSPSQYLNKYSWDAVRRRTMYTHMNTNGVVPGPPFPPPGCYPIRPHLISGAYGIENMPKRRGTGTYIPNGNYRAYQERQSPGRGRNPAPANQLLRPHNNGRAETALDTNFLEKGSQDPLSQAQLPFCTVNEHSKLAQVDIHKSLPATLKSSPHANGFLFPSTGKVEFFGSFGPIPFGASSPELGKRMDSVQGSGPAIPGTVQRPVTSSNPERPREPYQLKNDDDFPPLSG